MKSTQSLTFENIYQVSVVGIMSSSAREGRN